MAFKANTSLSATRPPSKAGAQRPPEIGRMLGAWAWPPSARRHGRQRACPESLQSVPLPYCGSSPATQFGGPEIFKRPNRIGSTSGSAQALHGRSALFSTEEGKERPRCSGAPSRRLLSSRPTTFSISDEDINDSKSVLTMVRGKSLCGERILEAFRALPPAPAEPQIGRLWNIMRLTKQPGTRRAQRTQPRPRTVGIEAQRLP